MATAATRCLVWSVKGPMVRTAVMASTQIPVMLRGIRQILTFNVRDDVSKVATATIICNGVLQAPTFSKMN